MALMLIVRGVPRIRSGRSSAARIDGVGARARQQRAARGIAPRADERRQAGDRADRVAAAGVALQPVVHANRRRLRRRVLARKLRHGLRRRCRRCRRRARGGYSAARAAQRVEAQRVARDVIVVEEILGDQHVHHAERERGVRAGHERDVLVALLRGLAAIGIDRDQLRAAALRFLRARPEMQIGDDRIAAPDEDQPALVEVLDVGAHRRADRRGPAGLAGRRADRAIEQRCAEPVEEAAVHRPVLQQSHRPGIGIRNDRLRAVGRARDLAETRGDRVERLVPADALEAPFALAARRVSSDAARARWNTSARDTARPSCTACRRSAGGRPRRECRSARPSSTVTSIAQVSGQSCGHAPRTTRRVGKGSRGIGRRLRWTIDIMNGCRADPKCRAFPGSAGWVAPVFFEP